MAQIQFSEGINEPVVPEIQLTKSKTGEQGKASFYFEKPAILGNDVNADITGMYMIGLCGLWIVILPQMG
jgi:photosystem II 13kDa protein